MGHQKKRSYIIRALALRPYDLRPGEAPPPARQDSKHNIILKHKIHDFLEIIFFTHYQDRARLVERGAGRGPKKTTRNDYFEMGNMPTTR